VFSLLFVPDERLAKLARVSSSEKIISAVVEFVDIAGLVKGAHKGEGLGNKFLSHIKEVDAIAHVVRAFESEDVVHVEGKINPQQDIETILLELIMTDLEQISKRIDGLSGKARTGDTDSEKRLSVYEKIFAALNKGERANSIALSAEELILTRELKLLTQKPMLYIVNVSEQEQGIQTGELLIKLGLSIPVEAVLPLNIQLEAELIDLPPEEAAEYLQAIGLTETGLDKFIRSSYALLNLISFFTSGEKETRAWTIHTSQKAPQAAGVIHTDMEQGFIRAEVVSYTKFIEANGWIGAKERGFTRIEGKEYEMQDGDVCHFRFNVS
jgi:GTP-binding protein YchF